MTDYSRKCMGQFQVATVYGNDEEGSRIDGKDNDPRSGESSAARGEEPSAWRDIEAHDEQIISPASYVPVLVFFCHLLIQFYGGFNDNRQHSYARQRAYGLDPQSPNSGATRFFRRIHVISTIDGSLLSLHAEQPSVVNTQGSDGHIPLDTTIDGVRTHLFASLGR
jgi:hypothetical protein